MKKLLICIVMTHLFTNPVFAESELGNVKGNGVSAEKNEQSEESTICYFKNGMNSSLLSLVYS